MPGFYFGLHKGPYKPLALGTQFGRYWLYDARSLGTSLDGEAQPMRSDQILWQFHPFESGEYEEKQKQKVSRFGECGQNRGTSKGGSPFHLAVTLVSSNID